VGDNYLRGYSDTFSPLDVKARFDHRPSDDNSPQSVIHTETQTKAQASLYWDGTQSQQFDKLLDDIWERSQEYQGYFEAEEADKRAVWSPSEFKQVRPSKTEGNIKHEESVPYVCVGQPAILQVSESDDEIKRPIRALNIEDAKAYKRSTSAYSTIHDYDLNWQQSFHIQQKNKDKVGRTLKR
jgi:hypothetical protein